MVWHPVRNLLISVSTTGEIYIWGRVYRENWSAFAPDFEELPENQVMSMLCPSHDVRLACECMHRLCCLFLPSDVSFSLCPLTHCKSLALSSYLPHAAGVSICFSLSVSVAFLCVEGQGGRERNRGTGKERGRVPMCGCVSVCPRMQSCMRA
jgi:hypothetical protein